MAGLHIVDMHCDTISELLRKQENGEEVTLRENFLHVDLQRMRDAGYLLQNFALYVDKGVYPDVGNRAWKLAALYEAELQRNADWLAPIYSFQDILENEKQGKMSAMLTLEEGAILQGRVENLHRFYEKGVRMIALTWNYPNEIGYPNRDGHEQKGLTEVGIEIVQEMQHLGVLVDVSHLSDGGFYDVIRYTNKPFVASHSNARSVCPAARNLTDDMIRKIGERGGVIGLNFYPPFIDSGKGESIVAHAKHIVQVGGIEVLGLGSDFDGFYETADFAGAQDMPRVLELLQQAGFTMSQMDKISKENVLRVYKEVLSE